MKQTVHMKKSRKRQNSSQTGTKKKYIQKNTKRIVDKDDNFVYVGNGLLAQMYAMTPVKCKTTDGGEVTIWV